MKEGNEVFELCKQVYEATGWKYTIGKFHDDGSYDGYVGHGGVAYTPNPQDSEWLPKNIPLYTSDYLLEKLPVGTNISKTNTNTTEPSIYYSATCRNNGIHQGGTPLQALLKLTISLHEEGLL